MHMGIKIIIILSSIVFITWFLFAGTINYWHFTEILGEPDERWICEQHEPEYYKTDEGQCWEDWRNDLFKDSTIRVIIKP